jgi:type I restriction enzyme S subunit
MNKNAKMTALLPKYRFPEFRANDDWCAYTLSDISERITEKVGSKQLVTLSISAGAGFVSQTEKFNRDISGKQYENYIHLRVGELSYNKGNSKKFPQGCIYELKEYDEAAVPSAFISFRFYDGFIADFFRGYFETNFHGKQLKRFITSGARSDGLLNVNPTDFFSIILPAPKDKAEQQKISDCLTSLDELIAAEDKKLRLLQTHKKGLMQKLFPAEGKTVPEWRFPEFRDSGEWGKRCLLSLCDMKAGKFVSASNIHTKREDNMYPCYGGNGLRGYTYSFTHSGEYSLIGRQGALCGNVTYVVGEFHATEHAIVATSESLVIAKWLYYLLIKLDLNKCATGQAQPGLSVQMIEKVMTFAPREKEEQQKIADCLSALDERITAQAEKIEALKLHKKGLMQGLFPSAQEVIE